MVSGMYDDKRLELCRRIMKELVAISFMNGRPIEIERYSRGIYKARAWRDMTTGEDRFDVSFDANIKIKINSIDEYVDEIVRYHCETYTVFLAVMELCEDMVSMSNVLSFRDIDWKVNGVPSIKFRLLGKYDIVFEGHIQYVPHLISVTFYYDKYHIAIPVLSTFPFLPLIDIMLGMECLP